MNTESDRLPDESVQEYKKRIEAFVDGLRANNASLKELSARAEGKKYKSPKAVQAMIDEINTSLDSVMKSAEEAQKRLGL